MESDNFVPFGRPQSGTVIIQYMTKLDVSNNSIPEQQFQSHLESKAMRLFLRLNGQSMTLNIACSNPSFTLDFVRKC